MSEEVPATSVAEPTTPTTPAPEAAPATSPEQPAQTEATAPTEGAQNTYFTNEQLAEMQKFIENNGGYDSAWKKMKAGISAPQQKAPEQPVAPQMPQQPVQAPEAPQTAPQSRRDGSFSIEEYTIKNYFQSLANEPQYASIADEIRHGDVLKALKDFNIEPVTDGYINDENVRKYLDLYAATKPATQTSVTPEATARVDYYDVPDEKAMTYEQATQIELQNIRLKAAGQPLHPLTDKAKEVVKAHFAPKK